MTVTVWTRERSARTPPTDCYIKEAVMATLNTPVSPPEEPAWHPEPDHDAADTAALYPIAAQPPPKGYRFGAAAGFVAALLLVVIGVAAYFIEETK